MTAEIKSFIPVAADSHFPIQNLPYGIFTSARASTPRVGVAIGQFVLDLAALEQKGLLQADDSGAVVFEAPSLNRFLSLGRAAWQRVRARLQELLREDVAELRDDTELREAVLLPVELCDLHVPVDVPDYTDFYSSRYHATNVGTMIRGADNALQPNWLRLPVAYHGRASSLVASGTDVVRTDR